MGPVDFSTIRYTDDDAEIRIDALTAEAWVENSQSGAAYTNSADGNQRLDWIVIGGESGPGARPFNIEWARSIMAQCKDSRLPKYVPVFVKQIGKRPIVRTHPTAPDGTAPLLIFHRKGGDPAEWPEDLRIREYPCDSNFHRRGLRT